MTCAHVTRPVLRPWRRGYEEDYRPQQWDYNSCELSYKLAEKHPGLVQLRADLAPLPYAAAIAAVAAVTPVDMFHGSYGRCSRLIGGGAPRAVQAPLNPNPV